MIRIALVVPCKNFIDVARKTFEEHNKLDTTYNYDTYELQEVIVTEKNVHDIKINADVIITRGLLAQILKNIQGDIPVVEINVMASELIRTITSCKQKYGSKKIGIIVAYNMLAGLNELANTMADTQIQSYILSTQWNGQALVDRALKDNCEIIIGGLNTCNYATMINVDNMLIKTSEESFWESLTSAKRAIQISRKEQEKSKRLQVILDSSNDGIISIDMTSKKIDTINKRAMELLKVDGITGIHVQNAPFPIDFKNLLINNKEFVNHIFKYNDLLFNISKYFVKVKNTVASTVINFQEVSSFQELEHTIRKTIYNKGHFAKYKFNDIIGNSKSMSEAINKAKKFSKTNSNILLIGESGTGKEIFAQSIHNYSNRNTGPFVAVNCAAIPENLLESELFGYTQGAFTGAQKNGKPGYFELAHKGTIFLDEIGEIPISLQAKLLRVIQEKQIVRLGGENIIPVDIRIIAATNQNLEENIKNNQFRQDLYFRLDVLRINLPSLSERIDDIPLLAEHFLRKNFNNTQITEEAKLKLCDFTFPGNIRHLFNICERLAVLKENSLITKEDVESVINLPSSTTYKNIETQSLLKNSTITLPKDEKELILQTLKKYKYNRTLTAKALNMDRSTLWRKMKNYNL